VFVKLNFLVFYICKNFEYLIVGVDYEFFDNVCC